MKTQRNQSEPVAGRPVRDIGHVLDVSGILLAVGVDHDAVTLAARSAITLGPAERAEFSSLYFEAERQAEEWRGRDNRE